MHCVCVVVVVVVAVVAVVAVVVVVAAAAAVVSYESRLGVDEGLKAHTNTQYLGLTGG